VYEVSKAVIDTNVLVYDIFEDSIHHREASRLLDDLRRWIIPSIVIHELIWFLRGMNIDTRVAIDVVLQYLRSYKTEIIPISTRDVVDAVSTIKQEGLSLSRYNDKLILTIALRLKSPLASFNNRLRREALNKGIMVLPKSI